eukprot:334379-Amphidinium_carterae.1
MLQSKQNLSREPAYLAALLHLPRHVPGVAEEGTLSSTDTSGTANSEEGSSTSSTRDMSVATAGDEVMSQRPEKVSGFWCGRRYRPRSLRSSCY